MEWIVADTTVSDSPLYSPSETPLPCQCSCRNSLEPSAPPPCDNRTGTEVLNILARLPPVATEQLVAADGANVERYVTGSATTWESISDASSMWFWIHHGLLP